MTTPLPERRRGSLALGLVLGVLAGLVLLGVAWVVLSQRDVAGTPTPPPARPTPTADAPTTPATPGGSPSATPASPSPSASPTPTPTPEEPPAGAVTQLAPGTQFVVLESMPKATVGFDEAAARAAALKADRVVNVVVVDSDAVAPTLNGGYWAVGVPDAVSRDDVAAVCAAFDRTVGPTCYGRPVA